MRASPVPLSLQAVTMGMENTLSSFFSITPSIFRFLKSLGLGLNSDEIPKVHPITGWKIVVYDLVVPASRLGGLEDESVGQSK